VADKVQSSRREAVYSMFHVPCRALEVILDAQPIGVKAQIAKQVPGVYVSGWRRQAGSQAAESGDVDTVQDRRPRVSIVSCHVGRSWTLLDIVGRSWTLLDVVGRSWT
jgi:hypothetical protein